MLLDWLAVEFMESGWSLKHLHRLIVTSRAYRMRSSAEGTDDPNLRIDPDNHYVWRMNPRRMEGEVIRDIAPAPGRRTRLDDGRPGPADRRPPSRAPAERSTTAWPATSASRS